MLALRTGIASRWLALPARVRAQAGAAVTFVVALVVRETYNLTVERTYVPGNDAREYVLLAQHMLQWGCYCTWARGQPVAYRSPAFPLFLAAIFSVTGVNTLAARLVLGVVGSLTCVLAGIIARDLFGPRAGLIAGLVAATYPQLFIMDAWLYSESLAIFLFTASCLAVMRLARRPSPWGWTLTGALLGVTALARPNGVYALAAVVVWLALAVWQRRFTWRSAVVTSALVIVGFSVVLAPWTMRNFAITGGAFVPLSTGSGVVIAGSYDDASLRWPYFYGSWVNPWMNPFWDAHDRGLLNSIPQDCYGPCEVARDRITTQIGVHWALTHVQLLPKLLLLRWNNFWSPASSPDEGGMPIWRPFAELYPALIICLSAAGLFAIRRRWRQALIPALFAASVVAGALIFYGSPRMRAPMEPLLVAFAAGGALWLARLVWDAARPPAPAPPPVEPPALVSIHLASPSPSSQD